MQSQCGRSSLSTCSAQKKRKKEREKGASSMAASHVSKKGRYQRQHSLAVPWIFKSEVPSAWVAVCTGPHGLAFTLASLVVARATGYRRGKSIRYCQKIRHSFLRFLIRCIASSLVNYSYGDHSISFVLHVTARVQHDAAQIWTKEAKAGRFLA